ncbi:MAG: hypothetical protein VB835_20135 [Pirellulales bacterium]
MWTCPSCSETVEGDLVRCSSCGCDPGGAADGTPAPPIRRYTFASILLATTVVVGLVAIWRSSSLFATILIASVVAFCVLPIIFTIARDREPESDD